MAKKRKPLTDRQRAEYDRRIANGKFKEMGRIRGEKLFQEEGSEYFRQMRAKRKDYRAGRAESEQ